MLVPMKARLLLTYTAFLLVGFAIPAGAAVSPSFSFPVAKAPHALSMDPTMTDGAWQAGKVPSDGRWENVTTRQPAESTTVYMLYDDKYLYVGFIAPQNGAPITATQTTNDVGFGTDDFVAVGIDTSGAGSQAYFFETTPRGVRYQQASENVRYRPEWDAAARIDGGTWRAVMRIPLDDLRLHAGNAETWHVGFFRSIAARGEHLTWAYDPIMQDQGAGAWPSFVDLRFWPSATALAIPRSAAARPRPRLEVFALSSSGEDRNVYQQGNGLFLPQETRPIGLDFSYPLAETINLVGTLNPDFSNVEVDQQTIAPQEFPRQLAEYRPFFAQGAQYLNPNPNGFSNLFTPSNLVFYSPAVGPFDRGAKVEGTYGLQSFGLLTFRGYDEATNDTFDDQAFGWKHSLQNQTFQYWADGVIANHSIAGHDQTFEFGAKGRNLQNGFVWQFDRADEHGDWVPQGNASSTNGFADVHQKNYEVFTGYVDITPNYNPLDGFTSNSDIRGPQGFLSLNGSTPGIKNWNFIVQGDRFLDGSGAVHEADFGAFFNMTFKNGWSINGLGPTVSELRNYDGNSFTGYPSYQNGETVPFNLMGVPIGYGDGTPTPFDVSANWGNFGGFWQHLYTSQTSRPLGSKFTLGLEYDGSYQRSLSDGTAKLAVSSPRFDRLQHIGNE